MNTAFAERKTATRPLIPTYTTNEQDFRSLPDHVVLAAKCYTDMVQGEPEHWISFNDAFEYLERKHGWK